MTFYFGTQAVLAITALMAVRKFLEGPDRKYFREITSPIQFLSRWNPELVRKGHSRDVRGGVDRGLLFSNSRRTVSGRLRQPLRSN